MHLLTVCLVLRSHYVALKIGRVEIIRPFNSVARSTSLLHFLLHGAITVRHWWLPNTGILDEITCLELAAETVRLNRKYLPLFLSKVPSPLSPYL